MNFKIKNIFALFFIFGAALIIYTNGYGLNLISIISTVSIMIFYFLFTLYINKSSNQISIEQLADSNYYLGFLFTIVSILTSLLSTILNIHNIDSIIMQFGISMISTLFGLLARVYLVNFIPTELSNRENINQSIANNLCKMDDIIFENMQKNKNLSKMIDTRMQLIVKSTQTTLEEFNRMLNYGFKSSLEEFENMITSLTKNIKNASEKQSEILLKEYEKINKKNKEYQEIIEKQNDAIQNINKNKEYQEIIEKQNDAIQNINKNIQDIHQQINKP